MAKGAAAKKGGSVEGAEDAENSQGGQDGYRVGYCKPPKETQFQKGQSGNLKGRPKRSKNTETIVTEVLSKTIKVREGDRLRTMSALEVMINKVANAAMTGDLRAFTKLMQMVEAHESKVASHAKAADSGPVLIIPGVIDPEEWAKAAAKQQAKYAGNTSDEDDDD